MPPVQRKRAGDETGRQAERLAEQNKEELLKRQAEISLTTQADAQAQLEPIDVDGGNANPEDVEDTTIEYDADYIEDDDDSGSIEAVPQPKVVAPAPVVVASTPDVHVEKARKTFRVNSPVEDMTFGYDHTYSFVPGQKYTAGKDLYDHLDSKGLIWH